jgi:tetratricopeptide (TPR) repeat protein
VLDLRGNTAGGDIRNEAHVHHHYGAVPAPPTAPVVRFGLVPPTPHFVGRGDLLARLAEGYAPGGPRPRVHVLCGLGGVGKTHLAARYVAENLATFPVAAWIKAEQDPTVDLGALADRLVTVAPTASPEDRARRVVEHLATTTRPWLLVFDNADDPAALRPFLPPSGPGQVLITTRSHEFHRLGTLVRVDEFDRRTAAAFLLGRAPGAGTGADAEDLAEALGNLPLALGHAAAYCADGTRFADYLDFLEDLPARELFGSEPEASHERTVTSTWQPSIAAATRRSPLAPAVLAVSAYLAPDDIPDDLFLALTDEPGTVRGRKQLADALGALHRYSLVERSADAFDMHRLLQKVVREDRADTADPEPARRAVGLLDDAVPGESEHPGTWPAFQRLAPHVTATRGALPPLDADTRARHVGVLIRVSHYLANAAAPGPALALAGEVARYSGDHLGADHPCTLEADHDLARSYWRAGRVADAVALGERVLADRRRILGADHPDTLMTRHHLATSYRTAGRTAEAIALQETLLADRHRILGPDHVSTLSTRHHLACSYWCAGRIDEAIALQEQVLADRRRILGADHPNTLDTRHDLALSYRSAGRTAEAVALQEQVVADRRRILGAEHPHTLTTGHELAVSYYGTGRGADAGALLGRIVADRGRILGPDHPDTGASRALLGRWAEDERGPGGDGA